jgi:NhaP-type Na+/H+ or K+/H+ antiporter
LSYYDAFIFILGLAFLASAWLSSKLTHLPFSLPMMWLGIGFFISFFGRNIPDINPFKYSALTEHLTELIIIISLLGAGLKVDRLMGWKSWNDTWRLLGITMPLSIALTTALSFYLLDFPFAVALLLGSLLAPTDPVLASDVQVGPPNKGEEHDVRFALTSEASLNDGLAFPFVMLAIVLTMKQPTGPIWIEWYIWYFVGKVIIGIVAGSTVGYLTAKLILKPIPKMIIRDEFIAIALAFIAYGSTQLIYGYGFLAVFIAAYVFRHYKHEHKFHTILYNFSDQVELLIVPILLVLMGIFIYQGIFAFLQWEEVLLSIIFIFLIRPFSGLVGLCGSKTTFYHKLIISIFGIRGIGSFYYLAYAINQTNYFNQYGQQLWRVSLLIVIISIVLHGMSASIIFRGFTYRK